MSNGTVPPCNAGQNVEANSCGESKDGKVVVSYDKPPPERGNWSGRFDFILTCIGYAVGLGNVWRFPYLCYKNGGGAFLIPYCLMLAFLGLPLFFLEFAFGQFASLGPISVWNISPLFRGIGYAMVLFSWILTIYYQIVVAHSLYYLFASMQSVLPWTYCGNPWNTNSCAVETNNITLLNDSLYSRPNSPSEEYYYNNVLTLTGGIDQIGIPSWWLVLTLLACWILCALAVIRGVQSLGKVSYFTSLFPYILLTIMLVRSFMLPGSIDGIKFYLYPEFSRLLQARVWVDAATQIFYSLGCCSGGLIAMSSFNRFKNNCCRDAIIVAVINCATSVYAGFVIFANLGFMARSKNTTVGQVAKEGPGLAFVVYPEALTKMPLPTLWAILFFFMMCTLGMGSQFSTVEAVVSGLQDELKRYGYVFSTYRLIFFRCLICAVNFLLGLPMVCGGGFYLFYLIDNYLSSYPLLLIALCETVVIGHVYGMSQFRHDIEMMINASPNWYWRICWTLITPVLCVALIIFLFINSSPLVFGDYVYPTWALVIGHLTAAAPVALIPGWFVYKYCREGGFILLREFFKPAFDWGPAEIEHRAEFLTNVRMRVHGSNHQTMNGETDISPGLLQSLTRSKELGGSTVSGLVGAGIINDNGFFQSKLCVAEKLSQAHTKEVIKRVTSSADFGSTDAQTVLFSSQSKLASPFTCHSTNLCDNSEAPVGTSQRPVTSIKENEKSASGGNQLSTV